MHVDEIKKIGRASIYGIRIEHPGEAILFLIFPLGFLRRCGAAERLSVFLNSAISVITICFLLSCALPAEEVKEGHSPALLRIDSLFDYDKQLISKKFRLGYKGKIWDLRVDVNGEGQSQYRINFKAFDTGKSKLVLSHLGSFEKITPEETLTPTTDFSALFLQELGQLPVLGKSTLELFQFNSMKSGDGTLRKFRVAFFSTNLNAGVQFFRDRDGGQSWQYSLTYHTPVLNITLGKSPEKKLVGVLFIKKAPLWHISLWSWLEESQTLSLRSYNAVKNGNTFFYNQWQADLVTLVQVFGVKSVNRPIFPSFLVFGDFSHEVVMTISPGSFRMVNQVGMKITDHFGVGGGGLLEKGEKEKITLSPVFSVFLRLKLFRQTLYLQGKYEDGGLAFYSNLKILL